MKWQKFLKSGAEGKSDVDFKKNVMYTITIYAWSVEGIYFEYGLRNKDESAVTNDGRRRDC